jgi:hypothetical protein
MSENGCLLKENSLCGIKSIVMQNDVVQLTMIPECGAKIISLIYRLTDYNFLWRNPEGIYSKNIPFVSGFDECIPSIGECEWQGTHIPDMGWVQSLPWSYEALEMSDEHVSVATRIASGQCEIERKISLKAGESCFRFEYEATNLSENKIELLWAAHPVLNANRYIRILLPPDVTRVTSLDNQKYNWPIMVENGKRINLSIVGEYGYGIGYKVFTPKLKEGWCVAANYLTGEMIGFSFNPNEIPFIGIWLNTGQWHRHYCMALEPTTSPTDCLDKAVSQFGEYLSLGPNKSRKWHMNIVLDRITGKIKGITPQGKVIQK